MYKAIVLCCLIAVCVAGCAKEEPVAPGPVPLADAAHMKQYLTGEWERVGAGENRWFRFSADGTFQAGGDGLSELLGFTAAVTEVNGRWDADMTTLRLSEIESAPDGGATLTTSLPLGWVDGKMNINIAGQQYRR